MRRLLLLVVFSLACTPTAITSPSIAPTAPAVGSPQATATLPPARPAPEASGCPVTLPASSWVPELASFTPLPPSRFSWYGNTTHLAVDLPVDGTYRVPSESSGLGAKIAWWRYDAGAVEIAARRTDGAPPEVRTTTTAGYGATGFNPSTVTFASEGCWRVTGSLNGRELAFVMFVRRAAPGEAAP